MIIKNKYSASLKEFNVGRFTNFKWLVIFNVKTCRHTDTKKAYNWCRMPDTN